MRIVGVDIRFVGKRMLDSDIISPTARKSRLDDYTISNGEHRSPDGSCDVHSKMASKSDVPPVIIGGSPKDGIYPSVLGIVFVFLVIGSDNPRKRHFTGVVER